MIFSSPYLRTLQTASSISRALSTPVPVKVEPGLREWVHRPNHPATLHLSQAEAEESFCLLDTSYMSALSCPISVECQQLLQERCVQFASHFTAMMRHLAASPALPDRLSIALVSHAAPSICLVRAFLADTSVPVRIATCSVSSLSFDTGSPSNVWEAHTIGRTRHLQAGALASWGFEDMEPQNITKSTEPAPLLMIPVSLEESKSS